MVTPAGPCFPQVEAELRVIACDSLNEAAASAGRRVRQEATCAGTTRPSADDEDAAWAASIFDDVGSVGEGADDEESGAPVVDLDHEIDGWTGYGAYLVLLNMT